MPGYKQRTAQDSSGHTVLSTKARVQDFQEEGQGLDGQWAEIHPEIRSRPLLRLQNTRAGSSSNDSVNMKDIGTEVSQLDQILER